MKATPTAIPDVLIIEPKVFGDARGFFYESFNHKQPWVPPGFAHGLLVLSDPADFLYQTTDYYAPEHERALAWNDPTVAVEWPDIGVDFSLSTKDSAAPVFAAAEKFP